MQTQIVPAGTNLGSARCVRHQANFRMSLATVRHSTLSKFCAALIVVLVALPFTAPFSTVALADLTGETAGHEGALSTSKSSDKTTTVGIVAADLVTFSSEVVLQSIEFTHRTDLRQPRITVLRL